MCNYFPTIYTTELVFSFLGPGLGGVKEGLDLRGGETNGVDNVALKGPGKRAKDAIAAEGDDAFGVVFEGGYEVTVSGVFGGFLGCGW
jgi:hypothetical protein